MTPGVCRCVYSCWWRGPRSPNQVTGSPPTDAARHPPRTLALARTTVSIRLPVVPHPADETQQGQSRDTT